MGCGPQLACRFRGLSCAAYSPLPCALHDAEIHQVAPGSRLSSGYKSHRAVDRRPFPEPRVGASCHSTHRALHDTHLLHHIHILLRPVHDGQIRHGHDADRRGDRRLLSDGGSVGGFRGTSQEILRSPGDVHLSGSLRSRPDHDRVCQKLHRAYNRLARDRIRLRHRAARHLQQDHIYRPDPQAGYEILRLCAVVKLRGHNDGAVCRLLLPQAVSLHGSRLRVRVFGCSGGPASDMGALRA